jgi:hypothetical protein
MFEKVTDTTQLDGFVARTNTDPNACRHRKRAGHEFGGDREAGVELSDA